MLNAMDLAYKYHLWSTKRDNDAPVPNGTLVETFVKDYLNSHNYKGSDYYYINPYSVSFEVFPEQLVTPIMEEFITQSFASGMEPSREKVYVYTSPITNTVVQFMYFDDTEEPPKDGVVVPYEEFLKRKNKKGNE